MSKVGQELGNKLSVKSFGWDKAALQKAVLTDQANDTFLCRFFGVATALKPYKDKETGETRYGLAGAFEGIHGQTGETKKGSTLYLPKYVQDMVEAALTMSDDVASVRIGFDIYARFDADSATSYVFVANDILNEGNATVDMVKEAVMALPMPGTPQAKALENKSK